MACRVPSPALFPAVDMDLILALNKSIQKHVWHSLLAPAMCCPSQHGTAALVLPPCWGKALTFFRPVLPVLLTTFHQCSSRSPISPGQGANPAVPLHGCALCHLYVKNTIKMPYSHSTAAFIFLSQLATARLMEAMGAKATGRVTSRAGSRNVAPAILTPSSNELLLPWSFAGWGEQRSISQIACS